jgi:hypothetical protein
VGDEVAEIDVNSYRKDEIIAELRNSGVDFEDAGQKIYLFHIENSPGGLERFEEMMKRRQATLEDVFFRLTGRSLLE